MFAHKLGNSVDETARILRENGNRPTFRTLRLININDGSSLGSELFGSVWYTDLVDRDVIVRRNRLRTIAEKLTDDPESVRVWTSNSRALAARNVYRFTAQWNEGGERMTMILWVIKETPKVIIPDPSAPHTGNRGAW
jgi:hypothetical protein